MVDLDRKAYDFTHVVFDRMDERGIEVTPMIATVTRAFAAEMVELMALFESDDDEGR